MLGRSNHVNQLTQLIDDLRSRSAPERLPHVAKGLGDAWFTLQGVLSSREFRAHVGNAFPEVPALISNSDNAELASPALAEACSIGACRASSTPARALPDPARALPDLPRHTSSLSRVQRLNAPPGSARKLQSIKVDDDIEDMDGISTRSTTPTLQDEDGISVMAITPTASRGDKRLQVEVQRLRPSRIPGRSPRHHDQRCLELFDGRLLIFAKGSQTKEIFNVDLQREVKHVALLSARRLQLSIVTNRGVAENKDYLFEFASEEAAYSFCEELLRQGGEA